MVYKVKCKECEALYVGETMRRLETRMTEHRRAVQRGETNVSALADHAWTVNHHIDWGSTTVLGVNPRYYARLTLEAIHIRGQKGSLNRDSGRLDTVYNSLLCGSLRNK